MLAKRLIVAAFAAIAALFIPLAFSGPQDLFTDTPSALLTSAASGGATDALE